MTDFLDTTPAMSLELIGALNNVNMATDDTEVVLLVEPLPVEPGVGAAKRDLEARQGAGKRVFEAVGYRKAYAACIGKWIYVTPEGELVIVHETGEEVGRSAEVDHLFELQLVKMFLEDAEKNGWLGGLKAADMYKKCTSCEKLNQELTNILNNPTNFWGVDKDINRAKGQVLGRKTFDFEKFDAAHASGFEKYMDDIKGPFLEIAGKIAKALEQFFNMPGLAQRFQEWADAHYEEAMKQIRDYARVAGEKAVQDDKRRKTVNLKATITHGKRDKKPIRGVLPDLEHCTAVPELQSGVQSTFDNLVNRFFSIGPFASILN